MIFNNQISKLFFSFLLIVNVSYAENLLYTDFQKMCEFNKVSNLLMDLDKDSSIPMIIIRPHPAVNIQKYRNYLKNTTSLSQMIMLNFMNIVKTKI